MIHRFSILLVLLVSGAVGAAERPNVLLIMVDDLKPALGCYGDSIAVTPNIDELAAKSMRFDLAYCNQAVCAPSRFTLMLGSHSTSTGLYGLGSQLRELVPHAVTLPQYFAEHGYRTESLGKVFHIGHGNRGDAASFSVPHFHDKVIEYVDPASATAGQLTREEALFGNERLGEIRSLPRGAAYESPTVDDSAYADGRVAAEAVKRLQAAQQRREQSGTPFFIAVGFARPHLPFSVPQRYWDLYDADQLQLPEQKELPTNAPAVAGKRGGEIAAYEPVEPSGVVGSDLARKLTHGYYASTSFADAQIGKVLSELQRLELTQNTIVLLWGDHGFHLGDHGIWTKHTNYEQATRIPLLISMPGNVRPGVTEQLAESVDVFPTLAELAGLPAPSGPQPIDGKSLVPVLEEPSARVRDHAYHVYPKSKLGRAIRTSRYRLVEWKPLRRQEAKAELELYDYETDPHETKNIANERPEIVEQLLEKLAGYDPPVDPRAKQAAPQGAQAKGSRPNVITVFIDDMGWSDLSCFGGKAAKTEHIDQLAREGMRFTNFYVTSPICSPSRVSLTTGQYPQRWKVTSYLANRQANRKRGIAQWLDSKAPVLARELHAAGYATGHFGKWHMGGQRDVADAPLITAYGFDRSLTNFEGLGPRVLPLCDAFNDKPLHRHDLGSAKLGHGPIRWEDRSVVTAAFVSEALGFIDHAQARGVPFYLNLWPDDVHSPFFPPKRLREKTGETKRELYYAVLKAMDSQLGLLFDRVREDPALRDNTLIVVASDNGHEEGAGSSAPLRGAKTWLYEGGVRSPLIVWGPGLVSSDASGTTNDTSILSTLDLNRSLYTITSTSLPDGVKLDGEDLAPTLLGKRKESRAAPLFWRRPPDRPGTKDEPNPDLAARNGQWKFYINYDATGIQLYNLNVDMSEQNNVADAHPEIVSQFRKEVFAWNRELPADAGDPSFSN